MILSLLNRRLLPGLARTSSLLHQNYEKNQMDVLPSNIKLMCPTLKSNAVEIKEDILAL